MKRIWLVMLLAAAFAPLAIAKGEPQAGLAETLKAAGRFTTYLSLQEAAGFRDLGLGPVQPGAAQKPDPDVIGATQGQHTFLVPNDAAFAKLPPGTVEALKADPERLNAFLQTHAFRDKMLAAGMIVVAVRPTDKVVKSAQGRGIEISGGAQGGEQQIRLRLAGERAAGRKGAPVARIGKLRDALVAEGVVQEIDAVLGSDELIGCGLHGPSEDCKDGSDAAQ